MDSQLETEQQEGAKKAESRILFAVGIKFILAYMILLMFDVLLDGFMAVLDLAVEFIHVLIEIFEALAEEGLEKVLHTKHQQSEMIILNSALIGVLIVLYYFIKALPHMVVAAEKLLLQKLKVYWTSSLLHWKSYSIWMKLKLSIVYILGFLGLTLLIG